MTNKKFLKAYNAKYKLNSTHTFLKKQAQNLGLQTQNQKQGS